MQNVLVNWGRSSDVFKFCVHDDGDFFVDETESLLTQTIQKLVGKADGSIEKARDTENRFFCDVLLAFEEDMKAMKALYRDMKARDDDGVSISPYENRGITFYLPCLPREHKGTDADDGADAFIRSYMKPLAKLYAVWKTSLPGPNQPLSSSLHQGLAK